MNKLYIITLFLVALVSSVYSLSCSVTTEPNPPCTPATLVCGDVRSCFELTQGLKDTETTIVIETGTYYQCIGELAFRLNSTINIQPQDDYQDIHFYCNQTFLTVSGGDTLATLNIYNLTVISTPNSFDNDGIVSTANIPGSSLSIYNTFISNKQVAISSTGFKIYIEEVLLNNNTFGIVEFGPSFESPSVTVVESHFVNTIENAILVTNSPVSVQNSVFSQGSGTAIVTQSASAILSISNCTFDSNYAADISAINTQSPTTVSYSNFIYNSGAKFGTFFINGTKVSLNNNYFAKNVGNYSGDLYLEAGAALPIFGGVNQFINSTCKQCSSNPNLIQSFGPNISYSTYGYVNIESSDIQQCTGLPVVFNQLSTPYYTCIGVNGCIHGYATIVNTKVQSCACFPGYTGQTCGEATATTSTTGPSTTSTTSTTGPSTTSTTSTTGPSTTASTTSTTGPSTTASTTSTTSTTGPSTTASTTSTTGPSTTSTTSTTGPSTTSTTGPSTTASTTTTTGPSTTASTTTTTSGPSTTASTTSTTSTTGPSSTTSTSTTGTSTSSSTGSSSKHSNEGKIVGAIVGTIVGVVVLGSVGGYFYWKKFKKPYQGYSHI